MLNISNITSIDGRYYEETNNIREVFSEYHLIKNRVLVEIEWLKKQNEINLINLSKKEIEVLDNIIKNFNESEALKVKEIESTTKHDVKAVEYYINNILDNNNMSKYKSNVHILCTSEDINNLSYGIMETNIKDEYIKNIEELLNVLKTKADSYKDIPMLSHTHGQKATPTTIGKELINYYYRINNMLNRLKELKLTGKFNGTVGNYNAHIVSFPDIDWLEESKKFVESFNLDFNMYTTQIENHDTVNYMFSLIKLINNIVLDLDNDFWLYISHAYFNQENKKGEVGSSVMPHKINPINFENSIANFRMSNSMIDSFVNYLQISRMQRDLTDSSMLRNMGTCVSYAVLSIKQTIKGLSRVTPNTTKLENELNESYEVLAEAIQTILRKNNVENAYEILKGLTRGKEMSKSSIEEFINTLDIPSTDKEILLNLEPKTYIGLASNLVDKIKEA